MSDKPRAFAEADLKTLAPKYREYTQVCQQHGVEPLRPSEWMMRHKVHELTVINAKAIELLTTLSDGADKAMQAKIIAIIEESSAWLLDYGRQFCLPIPH